MMEAPQLTDNKGNFGFLTARTTAGTELGLEETVTHPTPATQTSDMLRRDTILVVDDEPGPRQSLRMILQPRHDVVEARDASEALQRLESESVDLMTLDLNMPGMKGDELLRVVRRAHPSVEVVVVTGKPSVESATEALRLGVGDYLRKPFDVLQVNAAVSRCLKRQGGRRSLVSFLENLSEAVGQRDSLGAILDRVDVDPGARRRVGDLLETLATPGSADLPAADTLSFLEVLADTVERQSGFLRGHARRTGFYSGLLADRLGLGPDEREHVRISGFLHDIGKIGVPTDLLVKPSGLTTKERMTLQRHPEIGARMIEPLGLAPAISMAIRHHHEWWDGRGYGDGLFGEQIPLSARIVGLVDAYDAMTCDRPYRKALPADVVRAEIEKCAGVQFDPELAREFLRILDTSEMALPALAEPRAGGLVAPMPVSMAPAAGF